MTSQDCAHAADRLLSALRAQENALVESDWQAFFSAHADVRQVLSMIELPSHLLDEAERAQIRSVLDSCEATLATSVATLRHRVELHARSLHHAKTGTATSGRIINRKG